MDCNGLSCSQQGWQCKHPVCVVGYGWGAFNNKWRILLFAQDADAEIVVVATATTYVTSHIAMRSRVYPVLGNIKWGWGFTPCVIPPTTSQDGRTKVLWHTFHDLTPLHPLAQSRAASRGGSRRTTQQHASHGMSHGGMQGSGQLHGVDHRDVWQLGEEVWTEPPSITSSATGDTFSSGQGVRYHSGSSMEHPHVTLRQVRFQGERALSEPMVSVQQHPG